jgi:hypothetical protein
VREQETKYLAIRGIFLKDLPKYLPIDYPSRRVVARLHKAKSYGRAMLQKMGSKNI